jgi:hypothetical protein
MASQYEYQVALSFAGQEREGVGGDVCHTFGL